MISISFGVAFACVTSNAMSVCNNDDFSFLPSEKSAEWKVRGLCRARERDKRMMPCIAAKKI